jgi:hypothetical protein
VPIILSRLELLFSVRGISSSYLRRTSTFSRDTNYFPGKKSTSRLGSNPWIRSPTICVLCQQYGIYDTSLHDFSFDPISGWCRPRKLSRLQLLSSVRGISSSYPSRTSTSYHRTQLFFREKIHVKIGLEPTRVERHGFVVQPLNDCANRSLVYGIYDTSLHDFSFDPIAYQCQPR